PEALVEALAQRGGIRRQLIGQPCLADGLGELRGPALRVVDVSLYLAERDRTGRERAVRMRDAVVRILPPLVGEAASGLTLVLDETVAVHVSVCVDPA